jgi:carbon-monoxide dehydrogenase small subunit
MHPYKGIINIRVNGVMHTIEVKNNWTLLDVIRDGLGLTGTKCGCNKGECGACTVLMNGKSILSCLTLAVSAQGQEILTIEGLSKDQKLHPIQQSFVEHGAIQCGFCSPGMIMSAKALLDSNARPTEEEIRAGINGNLCRCTGYAKIVEAIMAAANKIGSL